MKLKLLSTLAALLAGAALVAGCSGGSGSSASSGPVNLTFWSWVPNMDKVVALWNSSHPDIHVTFSKQVSGDPMFAKLLTAAKAGNPPDLSQVEYQELPTLVSNNDAADISAYDGSLKNDFAPGVWQTVTLGTNAVYGVPQDVAPLALFYRTDEFTQYGLTVPTTWAQFAADATKLHQADPTKYLGTFSSEDAGLFAGLTQQAGARWWSASGTTWQVGIDDAASQQVANYWGGLVASGAINNQPMWTPAWNKGMDDGTYAAWVSAVWAPGDLVSVSADAKGKWAMAPLPQWTAGATATGSWGGSSTVVLAKSAHPQQAAQFAAWLNTNPTAVAALVTDGGIYPADTAAESGPAMSSPPDYFSNQANFYPLAKQIAGQTPAVTWGPDVDLAYSTFNDAFGAATSAKSSFLTPLTTMQQAVLADMKKSGFTVSG